MFTFKAKAQIGRGKIIDHNYETFRSLNWKKDGKEKVKIIVKKLIGGSYQTIKLNNRLNTSKWCVWKFEIRRRDILGTMS